MPRSCFTWCCPSIAASSERGGDVRPYSLAFTKVPHTSPLTPSNFALVCLHRLLDLPILSPAKLFISSCSVQSSPALIRVLTCVTGDRHTPAELKAQMCLNCCKASYLSITSWRTCTMLHYDIRKSWRNQASCSAPRTQGCLVYRHLRSTNVFTLCDH